ncbi:hypothetical protein EDB89DRAFT_1966245 [Lactarius sanguifluus]|nr:hypothetical protein EDB89DRAFT_2022084 [Lactarius sanguifluus]KAH9172268.1 hypothetical protein EDB89DRAFT_1966245 [Lactarius sanguifluus]
MATPTMTPYLLSLDDSQLGMDGTEIGWVLLFVSFEYQRKNFSCVLINWFVTADEHDPDTGMWPSGS